MTEAADPMAALRDRFRDRLADERPALEEAAERHDRATLRAICHRIAGSGGMFGYAELSRLASKIEEAVDEGYGCERLRDQLATLLAGIDEATGA